MGIRMRKSRIIGHLAELDGIRRDEYMPKEVVDKVIELEKILTKHLATELENPTPDDKAGKNGSSQNSISDPAGLPLNGV